MKGLFLVVWAFLPKQLPVGNSWFSLNKKRLAGSDVLWTRCAPPDLVHHVSATRPPYARHVSGLCAGLCMGFAPMCPPGVRSLSTFVQVFV